MVSYTRRGKGFLSESCACESRGYTKPQRKSKHVSKKNFSAPARSTPICKTVTTAKHKNSHGSCHTSYTPVHEVSHDDHKTCACKCDPCKSGHKKCAKPCADPCAKLEIKECQTDFGVCAEKNLLNLSFLTDARQQQISSPDISATYEIVITNKTCNKLTNLSIIDTLLGLQGNDLNQEGTFGGELRPYFTNVDVSTCDDTITPLAFEDIVDQNGQLVDTSKSYVPACSVCVITVRITGRGFLLAQDPEEGEQIPFVGQRNISMCVQNTAIVKGTLEVVDQCTCCTTEHPIFPIHVKSGEKQAIDVTNELNPDIIQTLVQIIQSQQQ